MMNKGITSRKNTVSNFFPSLILSRLNVSHYFDLRIAFRVWVDVTQSETNDSNISIEGKKPVQL
jgi:hypothetical protein